MQISKLEISRFIEAYEENKAFDTNERWLTNRNYLQDNGFELTDLIEKLVDEGYGQDKIIEVLTVLGVEVQ
jgi:hypothetical protein